MRFLILLVFFWLCTTGVHAQLNTLRCKRVKASAGSIVLDTLSIAPGSIKVSDSAVRYSFDFSSNNISLAGRFTTDSLTICYRVLAVQLHKKYFRRPIVLYDSNVFIPEYSGYRVLPEVKEQLFATPKLNKTGSLTRGISFGNTQNVFVNSALNLQMEGKLTDNITVTAAIADQNVPFQPQGNTQNIREFDKVFVQLENQKGKLIAGDVVLQNKQSDFLRFYKNVQGGQLTINAGDSLRGSQTVAAAAIAKGKFASVQVPVQEGVQGPYRLRTPNNEVFIIVYANSERVYLDGRLLKRGYNFDYTIDYNQGEIVFTNAIVITKFSRVRVDFEYAERNYSRSIINASHYQRVNRLNVFGNIYREADNPNQPLSFDIDTLAARRLANIGDTLSKAFISGATRVTDYADYQVLYNKVDTLGDSVYRFTPTQTDRMYRVVFSDVGEGNGAYSIRSGLANGRIYDWVGQGKGRYAPVRLIATPNQRAMATVGGSFEINKNEVLAAEVAISQTDLNRLSSIDNADNNGSGLKLGYTNKGTLLYRDYKWVFSSEYMRLSKNFNPIDRFRPIEFDRDWSANTGDTLRAVDNYFTMAAGIVKNPDNILNYSISRRVKGSNANGWQQQIALYKTLFNRLQVNTDYFGMSNDRTGEVSAWQRFAVDLYYKAPRLVPGYRYSIDRNKVTLSDTNYVLRSAMNFAEHRFYLRSNDTLKNKYYADYSFRTDKLVNKGELVPGTFAQTANAGITANSWRNHNLNVVFTYRNLENRLPTIATDNKIEETVMGRVDWNSDWLNRHVRSELTFSSATGRELRREFQYIRVPNLGEGTHQWIDFNKNNIQELDEFVEAVRPEDRQFIRVFVPTNEYIRAYTNNLAYKLNVTAPRSWLSKGGLLGFLSKFSNNSSWTADRKLTGANIGERFIPFREVPDEKLLSAQDVYRTILFFNRTNIQYGGDISWLDSRNKLLLTNGFETRLANELKLNMRANFLQFFSAQLGLLRSIRTTSSDFLANRNYRILDYEILPELSYQPSNTARFTGSFGLADKQNTFGNQANEGSEKALVKRYGLDVKINQVSARTINAGIKYIQIAYKGDPNSPVGYEMLEALRPGKNWTWTLNWQQRLANGLQLTFGYEGRKSDLQNVIHIGRMQVTALF